MNIEASLWQVTKQVKQLEKQFKRNAGDVRLLAVSKTRPLEAIQKAYQAGQRLFGESYVQEVVNKHQALSEFKDIEWHFIGPIQSNKSQFIAESMNWVHTIDREKIARRLNEQRTNEMSVLNVCIQVNISDENSKSGISLESLPGMVTLVKNLPNLQLRGLMAIPAPQKNEQTQIEVYKPLTQAYLELAATDSMIDTLSIGMSGDLAAAIASGSTMVRVGTAIFGERDYSHS